eukprot:jgi/Hompol1/4213/HPOL_006985-RA
MTSKDAAAIKTAAERRAAAFAHLDEAKLGWFHLRAVLVAGYDLFIIGQALPMIYKVWYPVGSFD